MIEVTPSHEIVHIGTADNAVSAVATFAKHQRDFATEKNTDNVSLLD